MNRLFIANIHYKASQHDLLKEFEPYGEVKYLKIVLDLETGESRGFGFVQYVDPNAARIALQEMDGRMFLGRPLAVREAHAPETQREAGSGRRPPGK